MSQQWGVTVRAGNLARRASLSAAAFAAVAAALLLVSPPELPQLQADLRGKASNATFLELQSDHYGVRAAGFQQECGHEFGYDTSPDAERFDGWHFVTRSGTDVVTLQVVFTDRSGAPQTYRIVSNGTSVSSTPGPGGHIAFSQDYSHVVVLTPDPGGYRILTATSPALQAPPDAEYPKTIYSRTALGTDEDVVGTFNLSHACADKPLTPPHSGCQYPDDDSLLRAAFSDTTLNGTLTCNGVAQPDQTVTATNGTQQLTTVTGTGGAFSLTGVPAGVTIVSFPGSTTVPAAPSIEVSR